MNMPVAPGQVYWEIFYNCNRPEIDTTASEQEAWSEAQSRKRKGDSVIIEAFRKGANDWANDEPIPGTRMIFDHESPDGRPIK